MVAAFDFFLLDSEARQISIQDEPCKFDGLNPLHLSRFLQGQQFQRICKVRQSRSALQPLPLLPPALLLDADTVPLSLDERVSVLSKALLFMHMCAASFRQMSTVWESG